MRKLYLGAAAALLAAGTPGSVFANDSFAAMGAGGLELRESADVRMASEELFISRRIIHVRYSFVNESGKPLTARVAFPLPDVNFEDLEEVEGWPSEDQKNVLDFKVTADGRAVTPELEQKAFYRGEDVTGVLRRLGVPFDYRTHELRMALKKLPDAAKAELVERGLADISENYVAAKWTLKSTFHWRQTFPADRPLNVTHEYRPMTGAAYTNPEMFFRDPQAFSLQYPAYCIDGVTLAGIEKRLRAAQARKGETAMLSLYFVDYVLTTGRNWKGPIGAFRLTMDKGRPDNLLSLCMDGVRKTGPTTFVVERKDFQPDQDLTLMFIEAAL